MKDFVLQHAPVFVQNLAISVFNTWQYWHRRRGVYDSKRKYFVWADKASPQEIEAEHTKRLKDFLDGAVKNSPWFSQYRAKALNEFPVQTKADLVEHFDKICTIEPAKGWESHTGGTTGASLRVIYAMSDMQERFAILDHFREVFGYRLGKRCAWFSGKSLVQPKDIARGTVWRDDYFNRIRFFSTFHITEDTFSHYWRGLEELQPEFIVGFPSSIVDICEIARRRGLTYKGRVKAAFPTAEMVLPESRALIEKTFGCRVADQYASSEGAHFILECLEGGKHIHPLTGVFEVVDKNLKPAQEGEILVTSFTTSGTPLIRYRIGDRIKLADANKRCACGSHFPLVDSIEGRNLDYIYSPQNGRVNQGNLSNCTKNVAGIKCFQLVQSKPNEVTVNVVGTDDFDHKQELVLIHDLRLRIGFEMKIDIVKLDELPREASGKFRFVKNSLPREFSER